MSGLPEVLNLSLTWDRPQQKQLNYPRSDIDYVMLTLITPSHVHFYCQIIFSGHILYSLFKYHAKSSPLTIVDRFFNNGINYCSPLGFMSSKSLLKVSTMNEKTADITLFKSKNRGASVSRLLDYLFQYLATEICPIAKIFPKLCSNFCQLLNEPSIDCQRY